MCWVGDQHRARQLAARSIDAIVNVLFDMFQSYEHCDGKFINEDKPIFKDIPTIHLSKEAKNLLSAVLNIDPFKRLTIQEIR